MGEKTSPETHPERSERWTSGLRLERPQCSACLHKYPGTLRCTAYPEGIPDVILAGEHDHRFPWPGDSGVTFTQDPEKPAFYDESDGED